MLKRLHISQFVIIDELELDLGNGLTTLTGETGAGKSILLDALGLVTGDQGEVDMIRQGSERSRIDAKFTVDAKSPLWEIIAAREILPAAELEITRILNRDGKEEITMNGKAIDVDLSREVGLHLLEIHGQFANHDLLKPEKQRELLDLFGGHRDLVVGTREAFHDVKRAEAALEEEKNFIALAGQDRDFLAKSVAEMRKLATKEGEYDQLVLLHQELLQTKRISEMLQSLQAQLVAGSGAGRALAQANHILSRQQGLDTEILATLTGHMKTALEQTNLGVDEVIRLMPLYELDHDKLKKTEERLEWMQKIAETHETEPAKIPALYETLGAKLKRLLDAVANLGKLQDKVLDAKRRYKEQAQLLSKARKKAGFEMGTAIKAELAPLRLASVEFLVDVNDMPGNLWGEHGIDEVNYTARTNPGMPFSTIAKTASGGELARMMLALKMILQRVQLTPTLIFDEVDTGIGGAAAAAVGERLARLAKQAQVLVVTHSAQVAARGDHHLNVAKKSDGKKTTSNVRMLAVQERIDEIGRMLAGDVVTPEAQAAAKSLLDESARAAASR